MRVLHVIDSAGLYGAESVVLTLMEAQAEAGHDPILASIGTPADCEKPIEAEARARGLRVETFRMMSGPNLAGALAIARFARTHDVDVIHSHGYKGDILLGFLPRRCVRRPILATLHGWSASARTGLTRIRLYEGLDALSLRRLDAVVLVNPGLARDRRLRHVAPERIVAIPNGLSDRESRPDPPVFEAIAQFKGAKTLIGNVGSLTPEKGHALLLEAFRDVLDGGLDVSLVILGEGPERAALEARVRDLRLDGRVLMPGYAPNSCAHMPQFDVYALSSSTEGLPITVLEAMRAAVPIVAMPVGAVPDVLEHGAAGLVVDPPNRAGLAAGIRRMCTDQELRGRVSSRAIEVVAERYAAEQMARSYDLLYRRLVAAA